jgi:GNAT superfamily N-acetyltransferase
MTYYINPAGPSNLDRVVELLELRTNWLSDRGSDQWSTNRHLLRARMNNAIAAGRTWILTDLKYNPVGTITISFDADPDFWSPAEQQDRAMYLSRLATDPRLAGQELGRAMLDWATWYAAGARCTEVRLDAWKTATGLHRYYVNRGWTYLRTVEAPGRYSGALFSRPAEPNIRFPEIDLTGTHHGDRIPRDY